MPIQYKNRDACNNLTGCGCPDKFGCPPGVCPDFTVRRHDTKPPIRISVSDCGQPLDLTEKVLEVNMWAKAKLKAAITTSSTTLAFADRIGFEQVMAGDTIIMDRVRSPEHMLVTGFDEDAGTITVQRGWNGTTPSAWKKGSSLRIFRVMNSPAETEMEYNDVEEVDGTITKDVLQASYFIYEWKPEDTCLPGCYYLEFKLLKMKGLTFFLPGGHWVGQFHRDADGNFLTGSAYSDSSVLLSFDAVPEEMRFLPDSTWTGPVHLHSDGRYYTGTVHDDGSVYLNNDGNASDESVAYNPDGPISVTPILDPSTFSTTSESEVSTTNVDQCKLGLGVEWVRRFPRTGDGFLIKIEDSPTAE